jgi:hypothetical protein
MSGVRRFFWNTKKAFMGTELLKYAPIKAATFPLLVILPAYLLLNAQKGTFY